MKPERYYRAGPGKSDVVVIANVKVIHSVEIPFNSSHL